MNTSDKVRPGQPAYSGQFRLIETLLNRPAMLTLGIIAAAFLAGTLFLAVSGYNPRHMYTSIIRSILGVDPDRIGNASGNAFNARYIGEWLTVSIPLILTGLSMAFALKTGLWNIGAEGQYTVGVLTATLTAFFFPPVPVLHSFACVLFAVLAGGIWGGLIGWFKARFQISEVVGTIMMNYIALFLLRIFVRLIPGTNTYRTPDFPATALLQAPWLKALTNRSELSYGLFWAILAVLFYFIIQEKTGFGLSLRITGHNQDGARYAGLPVRRHITMSMFIAGTFAGLAGAVVALGSFRYGRLLGAMDNYGFTGITVALVGQGATMATVWAGLLFGALQSAQGSMQQKGIPAEIVQIMIGLVVIFIAFQSGMRLLLEKRKQTLKQRQHSGLEVSDPKSG
ncbi:ABC transporter permease [Candidatus Haliotispira prima]|uniref:ABC transporter permease n=1 Tax=Candidatus Haliotispira prima TaxID=3034016 RepID=A0ABY8MFS8_9SPIO|nr:ABC transporter permease [Candidatus Haliotispira prima]